MHTFSSQPGLTCSSQKERHHDDGDVGICPVPKRTHTRADTSHRLTSDPKRVHYPFGYVHLSVFTKRPDPRSLLVASGRRLHATVQNRRTGQRPCAPLACRFCCIADLVIESVPCCSHTSHIRPGSYYLSRGGKAVPRLNAANLALPSSIIFPIS